MTREDLKERVDKMAQELGEYVDHVRIFAILDIQGTEVTYDAGSGSIYASIAHVQSWLNQQYERDREYVRSQR
jgi:hypothetical protein